MKKTKLFTNYDYFIRTDTSRYVGEWIAIANKQVISHGKNAQKVYQDASKKVKGVEVSLAKVPRKQMFVFTLHQ